MKNEGFYLFFHLIFLNVFSETMRKNEEFSVIFQTKKTGFFIRNSFIFMRNYW